MWLMQKAVSQRTIVVLMNVLRQQETFNYTESLYAIDFPDWFVTHAGSFYYWDWTRILIDMRSGRFFQNPYSYAASDSITGKYLSDDNMRRLGEYYIQRLAAYATTLASSENLMRSLEFDGFAVDAANFKLAPLEGPVSAQEEEDRLTALVKSSGAPNASTVLKHVGDAHSLYTQGKNHASLGESRNIIQALIDGISESTDANGKHSTKLPGGTANRITYLKDVGFFTEDEEAAFKSGWGYLSAGTHPGVPEREQARIGLVLALEFGQLSLMKFSNWKANAYRRFT